LAEVVWDKNTKAWVSPSGRLIAPRLDEEGIDLFFVETKEAKSARARYCMGEGYWAYGDDEVEKDYRDLIQHITKQNEDDIRKLLKDE